MKKILMLLLLLLPLAMASCGDDKDEPTNTTNDPDGTIIVNVNLHSIVSVSGCDILLDKSYNLSHNEGYGGSVSIVGPVKGIGSINITADQVQNRTWTTYAAAQVGYGYIFKSDTRTTGHYDYYAVYVASEIGSTSGVIGYTLKVRKLLENVPWQY